MVLFFDFKSSKSLYSTIIGGVKIDISISIFLNSSKLNSKILDPQKLPYALFTKSSNKVLFASKLPIQPLNSLFKVKLQSFPFSFKVIIFNSFFVSIFILLLNFLSIDFLLYLLIYLYPL